MPRKLISLTLTFLIIVCMVIPTFATVPSVNCSSEGSRVTISWGQRPARLQVFRDNVLFKDFQNNIQNGTQISFIETEAGTHTYRAKAISSDNSSDISNCTVVGTGKSSIRLEFINKHGTNTSVERIYNWVRIYNDGSNDIDLSRLKVRYFYTVDGEPSKVKETILPNPNKGQQLVECSDAKINPTKEYFQYPDGNKEKQVKEAVNMNFTKLVPIYKNSRGVTTADYYVDTYFINPQSRLSSASYSLTLQPAFNKQNLTNYESNGGAGLIKYYNPQNDYSFDPNATDWTENENICVYYDDQLIWGKEPFNELNAPTNLTAKVVGVKDVNLTWTASPGAKSYNVYRSKSHDADYSKIPTVNAITGTNFVDTTVQSPTESTGEKYYYKVVAVYNDILSDPSNIAAVTICIYSTNENWTLGCSIISDKSEPDFVLGTYIPVALKIVLHKDTEKPTITLQELLENLDLNLQNQLNAKIVSQDKTKGKKLLKATLTDSLEVSSPLESKVIIIDGHTIEFTDKFQAKESIYVEFVLKVSANDKKVLEEGINDYYNKGYILVFTMTGNVDDSPQLVSSSFNDLPVKIVKPDKLK